MPRDQDDTKEFRGKVCEDIVAYANNWFLKGVSPRTVARGILQAAGFSAGWAITYQSQSVLTAAELDAMCKEFRETVIKYVAQNAPAQNGLRT